MKKIIPLLILYSSSLMAQEFKSNLRGKFVPAKIKVSDDATIDVLMKYQTFEYFKFPQNKLIVSPSGSEADAQPYTGSIEAFMIDDIIWRILPGTGAYQYVILTQQGAIETYHYVKYGNKDDKENSVTVVLPNDSRTVSISRKIGSSNLVQGNLTSEKLKAWIADSPEIMRELQQADSLDAVARSEAENKKLTDDASAKESVVKEEKAAKPKGLLAKLEAAQKKEAALKAEPVTFTPATTDLSSIINNYNAWYEKNNPGKIKYYLVDPPVRRKTPLEEFREKQAKQEAYLKREKDKEEAKATAQKKIDDLFANRTETPSPENASAKDNVPVKKETFAAKLDRIKADGNKVGVILYMEPVRVNPPEATSSVAGLTDYTKVEGEYLDESLKSAANEFVAELNQALNTSIVELIDIKTIPYRQTKLGRIDDWWASKYKVVFAYTLDPRIRSSNEEIGGKIKFTATLNMLQSLIVREYIGGPGATKQDIITQVLNMGSFVTPTYAQDDQITDVKVLYDKVLEKLAVPVLSKIREERADGVKKLVEKRLN